MTATAATATPERRGPGRPRKVQQITKSEYIEDGPEGEGEENEGFSGLFDDETLKLISKVRVIRIEPNEGTVGYLEDPTMGEAEIAERWGGSTYKVQGIDGRGALRKSTTIKIAGDPRFVSTVAEMQWRRSRGLPMNPTTPGTPAAPQMSFQEIMALMQSQDERRRAEEREHAERMRKIELEAQAELRREVAQREERIARERIEAEARARRDEEERERRKVKDEEDRESRRRREQAEAEARQQQFMQQTIQMLQQSSNQALQFVRATAQPNQNGGLMEAVKTVVAIKEAFAGEGDGGEESVMQTLIKHGGEWINGLSTGIAGAVREIKSGGTSSASSTAPTTARANITGNTSPIALLPPTHPINEKVETLVAKLAAKGLDPMAAMSAIVDNVIKDVDKIPPQNRATAPTPTGAAEPPRAFTHDPNTVARVEPAAPVAAPVVAAPRVYRHSFGR